MVNNTVNGKKIGKSAGKDDKLKFNYFACGKQSQEQGMDTQINEKKSSISLIDSLRKNGQIIGETSSYVSIKAYPGGNPNKARNSSEEITH